MELWFPPIRAPRNGSDYWKLAIAFLGLVPSCKLFSSDGPIGSDCSCHQIQQARLSGILCTYTLDVRAPMKDGNIIVCAIVPGNCEPEESLCLYTTTASGPSCPSSVLQIEPVQQCSMRSDMSLGVDQQAAGNALDKCFGIICHRGNVLCSKDDITITTSPIPATCTKAGICEFELVDPDVGRKPQLKAHLRMAANVSIDSTKSEIPDRMGRRSTTDNSTRDFHPGCFVYLFLGTLLRLYQCFGQSFTILPTGTREQCVFPCSIES